MRATEDESLALLAIWNHVYDQCMDIILYGGAVRTCLWQQGKCQLWTGELLQEVEHL